MHFEILVEEPSSEVALSAILPAVLPDCTFKLHPHQGKTDLMERLPRKLAGYARWLPEDWRIVVLVDADRQDCLALKKRVLTMGEDAKLSSSLLCRIVVEELEAWFFGDVPALVKAYPGVPHNLGAKKKYRDPDAIGGGTWEALERVLQGAGYFTSGLPKIAVARAVAAHMNVEANSSRSFQVFRDGVRRVAQDGRRHSSSR